MTRPSSSSTIKWKDQSIKAVVVLILSFKERIKRESNMTFTPKDCGQVGHKTFTSNHFYWHFYQKRYQNKLFFTWLISYFNIPQTSTTSKMLVGEGLELLSWRNTSSLWIDHLKRLQVKWSTFDTMIHNFLFFSIAMDFAKDLNLPLSKIPFLLYW